MSKHPKTLDELLERNEELPVKPEPQYPFAEFDFFTPKREGTETLFHGHSLTRQEFAAECDINNLMERYQNQDIGAIMRAAGEPVYADFSEMPQDLMGFMKLMGDAENAFMTLPAQVRREFDNDAMRFVDFASDPANLSQMRGWGLAPPAPQAAAAAPPTAAAVAPHSSPLDVTVRTDTKDTKGDP